MKKSGYIAISILNMGIAIVSIIAYKLLSERYDNLLDKYWENNRQIALYDDEVRQIKKKNKSTSEDKV